LLRGLDLNQEAPAEPANGSEGIASSLSDRLAGEFASSSLSLLNPTSAIAQSQQKDIEEAARTIGLQVQFLKASNDSELEDACKSIVEDRIAALLVPADAFFAAARDRLAELAARNAVPAIYSLREFVVSGGLISYGNDLPETYRLIGAYAA
jgi:ABC-type uncharacterized transport system substrate-binding protein